MKLRTLLALSLLALAWLPSRAIAQPIFGAPPIPTCTLAAGVLQLSIVGSLTRVCGPLSHGSLATVTDAAGNSTCADVPGAAGGGTRALLLQFDSSLGAGGEWGCAAGNEAFAPDASPAVDHSAFNAESDARIAIHKALPNEHHTPHGDGADCTAGNSPLGVDAAGAAVGCFDVQTAAEQATHVGTGGAHHTVFGPAADPNTDHSGFAVATLAEIFTACAAAGGIFHNVGGAIACIAGFTVDALGNVTARTVDTLSIDGANGLKLKVNATGHLCTGLAAGEVILHTDGTSADTDHRFYACLSTDTTPREMAMMDPGRAISPTEVVLTSAAINWEPGVRIVLTVNDGTPGAEVGTVKFRVAQGAGGGNTVQRFWIQGNGPTWIKSGGAGLEGWLVADQSNTSNTWFKPPVSFTGEKQYDLPDSSGLLELISTTFTTATTIPATGEINSLSETWIIHGASSKTVNLPDAEDNREVCFINSGSGKLVLSPQAGDKFVLFGVGTTNGVDIESGAGLGQEICLTGAGGLDRWYANVASGQWAPAGGGPYVEGATVVFAGATLPASGVIDATGGTWILTNAGTATVNLPTAATGLDVCFMTGAAAKVVLEPQVGDKFILHSVDGTNGEFIESVAVAGQVVCIRGETAGLKWYATVHSGKWIHEGALPDEGTISSTLTAYPAAGTIPAAGETYIFRGAGTVTVALPTAATGMKACFITGSAQKIVLNTQAGDKLVFGTAEQTAGKDVESAAALNERGCIEADGTDNRWYFHADRGTWAMIP